MFSLGPMFTSLLEAIREHGPEAVALMTRYVEAKEMEAQALRRISDWPLEWKIARNEVTLTFTEKEK